MNNISTIFLADDDPDDRELFSDALAGGVWGDKRLLVAENGMELMEALQANANDLPDLIFLDLNMPCKTGYECLSEIKQHSEWKHLPVIIISTSVLQDAVNYVYQHGACRYIIKPNSFNQLKKMIEHVLSLYAGGELIRPSREHFILKEAYGAN